MKNKIKLILTTIICLTVFCIASSVHAKAATSLKDLGIIPGTEDNYQLPNSIYVEGNISINSNFEEIKYFSNNNEKYYLRIDMPKSGRLELYVSNKNNTGMSKDCRIAVLNSDLTECYGSDYIDSQGSPTSKKYYLYLYKGTYYVELSTRNCSGFSEGIKANAIYTSVNLTKGIESKNTAPTITIGKNNSYIVPYGANYTYYKLNLKRKSKVTISGANDNFSSIKYEIEKENDSTFSYTGASKIGYINQNKTIVLEKGTYYLHMETEGFCDGYSLDDTYGGYYNLKITAKDMVTKIKVKPKKRKKVYEIGQKIKVKATLYPTSARGKKVKWSSSNTNVATITKNGVIKTHKSGSSIIRAEADGIYGSWVIKVRAKKQNIVSATTTLDADYDFYWDELIYDYDINVTLNSKYNDKFADYEFWVSKNKKKWIEASKTSASYVRGKTVYGVCTDIQKKGTYYVKIRRVSKLNEYVDHGGKPVYSKWSNIKKFVIR